VHGRKALALSCGLQCQRLHSGQRATVSKADVQKAVHAELWPAAAEQPLPEMLEQPGHAPDTTAGGGNGREAQQEPSSCGVLFTVQGLLQDVQAAGCPATFEQVHNSLFSLPLGAVQLRRSCSAVRRFEPSCVSCY
jgi:hypothetical protein